MRENRPNFPTTRGSRINISMKLLYQYMAIFFTFSPTSNHFHPLQVENCDSNSRLVVDEDDNGKFRLESVNSFSSDVDYGSLCMCLSLETLIFVGPFVSNSSE